MNISLSQHTRKQRFSLNIINHNKPNISIHLENRVVIYQIQDQSLHCSHLFGLQKQEQQNFLV